MRCNLLKEGFSKEGFFSPPKFRVFLSLNVFCPFQKHLFLHGFSSTFNLKEEKRNKKSARVVLHENLL